MFGKGETIYLIERMNLVTGKAFDDGEHILYVNGEYQGDSELGRLLHDFNCRDADDMNYDLMAECTRYLKENEEGVSEVCKIMEEMRDKAAEEAAKAAAREVAVNFMKLGKVSYEEIAECTGLSLEEVNILAEQST